MRRQDGQAQRERGSEPSNFRSDGVSGATSVLTFTSSEVISSASFTFKRRLSCFFVLACKPGECKVFTSAPKTLNGTALVWPRLVWLNALKDRAVRSHLAKWGRGSQQLFEMTLGGMSVQGWGASWDGFLDIRTND